MPNWCSNYLKVLGQKHLIFEFQRAAEGTGTLISLDRFIPYPEQYKDDSGMEGYWWCVKNWGTKWDLFEVEIIAETSRSVTYLFDTAWSPPLAGVAAMSEKFPDLEFRIRFAEGGCDFSGYHCFKAGQCIKDRDGSYSDRHR